MIRRLTLVVAALLVLVPSVLVATSSAAAAADGLDYRSTTTYTLDAQAGLVHVLVDVSLRNTIADKRAGNVINRRYFTGFSLPVPVGVTNAVATTADGRALDLVPRLIDGNTRYYVFDIDLASNLFYNQTADVRIAYDITGLPPRSENQSRVNNAYASFTAFGIGDDGQVTVRIVVPPGFEVETFGSDTVVTEEFGNTVYTATDIPNPQEFDIFVSARNDDGLVATQVATAEGDEFLLRTWPGDTEWQAFVTAQIEDGVPALAELIGRPWPIDETLEVREAYTPYLYGYAGWFSAARNEIEIGEALDEETVLHELSHAWFNDDWFADRWLSEGFAQVYSNEVVEQTGGTSIEPESISTSDPGFVTLTEWGDPNFTDGADEVEAFGYNASYWIVQQIVDEIGEEAMREVLAAVADRTIAYVGEGEPESVGVVTDWRRFLDLVEEHGGSEATVGLIEQYVVAASAADSLTERAAAREAYAELIAAGEEWAPPMVLRRQMANWAFGPAQELIDEASAVLALRDELDDKAAQLGRTYPDDLETMYQDTRTNLVEVKEGVEELIETADAVLAAMESEAVDDGLFGKVGLLGTDLPTLLDEARAAFEAGDHDLARAKAQEVVDTIDDAPDVGKGRSLWVGGGVLLFLLLVTTLVLLLRRRKRRRRAATAAIEPEPGSEPEPEPEPEAEAEAEAEPKTETGPTESTFAVDSGGPDEGSAAQQVE